MSSDPFSRSVQISIDQASWRAQPASFRHTYPNELTTLGNKTDVHLLSMFLLLGELTTPTISASSGVARIWALLRYLHIISDKPGLRLHNKWKEADGHLKTLSSDDFGVGLGMTVLTNTFKYGRWIDGRAFLRAMNNAGLLAQVGGVAPKVGAMKMADYAVLDPNGKVHLIECKGTGGNRTTLRNAINTGIIQKRSLVCSSLSQERRLIGQRLVTGVLTKLDNARSDTELHITDPAPVDPEPAILRPRIRVADAIAPLWQVSLADAAVAAGAFRTADTIAGRTLYFDRQRLPDFTEFIDVESAFAADREVLARFDAVSESWIGQRATVPLWAPLEFSGKIYRKAHIEVGVSEQMPLFVRNEQSRGGRTSDVVAPFRLAGIEPLLKGDGPYAQLIRHGISYASVRLLT